MRFASSLLALALAAPAALFADAGVAKQLIDESRATHQLATQLASQLKNKNADLNGASSHLATFEQKAASLQTLANQLSASATNLTAKQRASIDTTVKLAEVLRVFVDNKKALLADGPTLDDRNALRAQYHSIALRAQLIEKHVSRLRL